MQWAPFENLMKSHGGIVLCTAGSAICIPAGLLVVMLTAGVTEKVHGLRWSCNVSPVGEQAGPKTHDIVKALMASYPTLYAKTAYGAWNTYLERSNLS